MNSCFDPSLFPTDFGGNFRTTKRCPRLNFFVPQFIFFTVSNSMTIEDIEACTNVQEKNMIKSDQIHLGMVLSRISNLFPRLEPRHPKLQSFSRGHIRSDADVLQRMEVQLKLCGNELQTFGQVVSKRSKMTKLNIFLPDICICDVSLCQGNEMFRLFFEVGLFNLAEKTGCSCYQ